mmetsp:Transcript_15658/g.23281  ORF Transcript_15658/g.23281 Transcript_15658/m.23281 type:complete len:96 (-) Transcript_15658:126-413(-)
MDGHYGLEGEESGESLAVLWKPVPEPCSLAIGSSLNSSALRLALAEVGEALGELREEPPDMKDCRRLEIRSSDSPPCLWCRKPCNCLAKTMGSKF